MCVGEKKTLHSLLASAHCLKQNCSFGLELALISLGFTKWVRG